MANVILAHNHFDADHLEAVKADMAVMGTPTIRVIDGGDHYIAIEGCHRLRAAEATDTAVCLEVLDEDETIDLDTLDIDTYGEFDEQVIPVTEFIEWFTREPFPMDAEMIKVDEA